MRVQVLLSTYNGAAFLRPQLDSLLYQTGVELSILIRDDGSTDNTVALIKDQIARYPQIRLIEGTNLGVVPSYFALMNAADPAVDFFAFCDQDDVWLPTKLATAVQTLAAFSLPAVFASPVLITQDGVTTVGQTPVPRKPLALGNALVQNRLIGCSVVFNRALLALVREFPPDTAQVNMHDWWVYLVAAAFGQVVFHPQPTLLYRQHTANVVGLKSDSMDAKMKRFKQNRRACSRQAQMFLDAFAPRLSAEQIQLIKRIADEYRLLPRIRLALSGQVYRQAAIDDLILKLLLVLNRV